MKPAATEFATRISRALISASSRSRSPVRSWTPSLEQTLHRLGVRNSLSPSLVARVIDPYLLTHHSLSLGFFNWASQQPNFSHDPLSYQSVLKSLSISRQFNAIDSILKQVKVNKVSLDSSVYRFIMGSLIQGKNPQKAFSVVDEFNLEIRDLGPELCNSLMAALISDGYYDSASKVFDQMSQRGIAFNTIGFGVFIWRYCKNAELGKVLSMLEDVNRSGNYVINGSIVAVLIIHGLCEVKRVDEAYRALDELRVRDCKPDFIAYRIVAEEFRLMGCVYEREVVLKKKRKLGVAPRTNDYREFILGLIADKRITEAKELGEVIISGNFPIDDDVLNSLIGSVSGFDPNSAVMFLDFMIAKGRLPTLLTLSNLSKNLCKHNKSEELVKVYEVLSAKEYFSDKESYNVMVSVLCEIGRVREAYAVLQEMKKKGYSLDVSFYNTLMEALCREDLLRPTKRLWDEMFANGCGGNLETYKILIRKFSECGEVDDGLRLFHHMLEKGLVPDSTIYLFLLDGLCQDMKFEAAFEVFNQALSQDMMLGCSVLSPFTLSLCRKGQFVAAVKLLQSLPSETAHSESHVILLKFLANAREFQVAVEHIKWIRETSLSLLQVIRNELSSLSSSSQPGPMLNLLQAVKEIGSQHFNIDAGKGISNTGC